MLRKFWDNSNYTAETKKRIKHQKKKFQPKDVSKILKISHYLTPPFNEDTTQLQNNPIKEANDPKVCANYLCNLFGVLLSNFDSFFSSLRQILKWPITKKWLSQVSFDPLLLLHFHTYIGQSSFTLAFQPFKQSLSRLAMHQLPLHNLNLTWWSRLNRIQQMT